MTTQADVQCIDRKRKGSQGSSKAALLCCKPSENARHPEHVCHRQENWLDFQDVRVNSRPQRLR